MSLKMNLGTGESTVAPGQQTMSFEQMMGAIASGNKQISENPDLKDYQAVPVGKGVGLKPRTASSTAAGDAEEIYKGIKDGNVAPTLAGLGRTGVAAKVAALAGKEGFDLKDMQQQYLASQTLIKSMNSNQMVQLQTAFNSVKNDLKPMRELNDEFQRSNIRIANKLNISMKENGISLDPTATDGLDKEQVRTAAKFVTQLNLMRDSMAVAFMRGGVPTETAFKLTDGILNPTLGSTYLGGALDQVETNVNLRNKSVEDLRPMMPGQSMLNQDNSSIPKVGGTFQGGRVTKITPVQ
jgi:hypothetical protein